MRADTKKKHEMGKRFAILIGVAAAGVMALGAQTGAAASEGVVKYGTKVTLDSHARHDLFGGSVESKVSECERGRRVVLFALRPGADRRVGTARTKFSSESGRPYQWAITARKGGRNAWYAKVRRQVHDEFVCGGDRSRLHDDRDSVVRALGAQTASSTTGDPVDSTPPDLQLSGPKKQSPQKASCPPSDPGCSSWICSHKRCNVIVRVSHTGEAFTVRAWGKLTNVKMDKLEPVGPIDLCPAGGCPPGEDAVRPGRDGIVHVGPELAKEQRKQVRQALDNGENVQAKVTVKATDAAGNVATAKRTITLVK